MQPSGICRLTQHALGQPWSPDALFSSHLGWTFPLANFLSWIVFLSCLHIIPIAKLISWIRRSPLSGYKHTCWWIDIFLHKLSFMDCFLAWFYHSNLIAKLINWIRKTLSSGVDECPFYFTNVISWIVFLAVLSFQLMNRLIRWTPTLWYKYTCSPIHILKLCLSLISCIIMYVIWERWDIKHVLLYEICI